MKNCAGIWQMNAWPPSFAVGSALHSIPSLTAKGADGIITNIKALYAYKLVIFL